MSKALYNPSPSKWLGTHVVSARIAAIMLEYSRMSGAYASLEPIDKCTVLNSMKGEVPKKDYMAHYYQGERLINPFNGKADSRIIKCSFLLSDGSTCTGRQWKDGRVILFTADGRWEGCRFYAK